MGLKRATLAGATAFIAINIWTGAPLLALWVGAQTAGQTALSMKAVFVVLLVLVVLVLVMAVALTWLNNTYEELIGRLQIEKRASWLRSEGHISRRVGITVLERIVVLSVYMAVVTLLIWFFVVAGSPLPR
jgi:hypothetical protein